MAAGEGICVRLRPLSDELLQEVDKTWKLSHKEGLGYVATGNHLWNEETFSPHWTITG